MNSQLKKGSLELCVLALLDQRDCYGYELVESLSQHLNVVEGTIYPLLRRLQEAGDCETYLKESDAGPSRKYYRLTHEGRQHLAYMRQEWQEFYKGVNRILKDKSI